jgi:enamine deaminase RidA (YjgF/YER057c/UK114 family)
MASTVHSTTNKLALSNICFSPEEGNTLCEKLINCYRQFTEYKQNRFLKSSIVKQSIFISAPNNSDYILRKQELLECANDFFDELPPTSLIAQAPDNGSLVVEFMCIEGLQPDELSFRKNDKASWVVIQRDEMKMLFAIGGSESIGQNDILHQSNNAFEQLQNILAEEDMEFSDIIRQWNYIEQITLSTQQNHCASQHYQIFNDIRSKYYQQSSFRNGFPAATGIGMDFGGIIIDIIAAKFGNEKSVVPIKSPVQLDAYSYTKEVLAENNYMKDFCRTTPKFERAKLIITAGNKCIFISGTAAIVGQASIIHDSVEHQTEMTILNILSLISKDNLQKHGIATIEKARINYLRVYVKYAKDIQQVRSVCMKHFPQLPVSFVVADICRPELLVEIEGQAELIN